MKLPQPAWPRSLPASTVVAFATLGPIGGRLPAPGTWGSLAGLCYFTVCFIGQAGSLGTLLLNGLGIYLAVALCGEAEVRLGKNDPGEVVLDEFVAMPLCFIGWPALLTVLPPWAIFLTGFVLFRVFDILKPLGIRKLQSLPGGWGVVADDVAAALATCLVMHLGKAIWLQL